ncbi:hypothetical protein SVIOM342S_04070 [Streptomyces violaceorubidus]
MRNAKRWQDVEELLAAGINVVSTVNIQHLESLGDVVESITGVRQRETVPDEVVRRADQIELVDMSPQAPRRRMAHGNIYTPDKVDAALSNYFRPGNLTALRELALLLVADRADQYLQQYRSEHRVSRIWGSRERIVVGLTGGPEGRTLIRRAARLAEKGAGGEVLAVYIARSDGLTSASPKELAVQRTLVEDLGGTFHHVLGEDIPAALLDFARGVNATQIVLGSSRRKTWQYVFGPGAGATVARESGADLDVHIVTHEEVAKGRGLPVAKGARLGRSRSVWGWFAGLGGPAPLSLLLSTVHLGLANDVLLYLALTVAAALLGGLYPALASAAVGSVLLNWFFTPPVNRITIADPKNILALAIYVGVALSVASVVDVAARRTHQAARLRAESEILALLAGTCCAARPAWRRSWSGCARPSAWSRPLSWSERATWRPGTARGTPGRDRRLTARRTRTWTCPSATTWPSRCTRASETVRTGRSCRLLVPCARSPCDRVRVFRPWRPSCSTVPPPWTWCGWATLHRGHRAGAQAHRIGPDLHEPPPPGRRPPEIRTGPHGREAPVTSLGSRSRDDSGRRRPRATQAALFDVRRRETAATVRRPPRAVTIVTLDDDLPMPAAAALAESAALVVVRS